MYRIGRGGGGQGRTSFQREKMFMDLTIEKLKTQASRHRLINGKVKRGKKQ